MHSRNRSLGFFLLALPLVIPHAFGNEFSPYDAPQTQREEVFTFSQKPNVRYLGNDKYELTFAVKGFCDATVTVVAKDGTVVRHLASGVLGTNAPAPFQKKALAQKIFWNGQDDLGAYVKNPESMSIKVALGLNPVFHRILGWNTHLPAGCSMIGVDSKNLYVVTQGQLRKYDHAGNYLKTVFPPAANIPLDKLKGLEALEVEKGKWALHSYVGHSAPKHNKFVPGGFNSTVSGFGTLWPGGTVQQVSIFDGWFTFATNGNRKQAVWLNRINTADGTSDDQGYAWRKITRSSRSGGSYGMFNEFSESVLQTALSPDKRWIYVSGLFKDRDFAHGIFRLDVTKRTALSRKIFIGNEDKGGTGNTQFNRPIGIACDTKGRIMVCDQRNNRIQAFSGEGKYLKSIKISKPYLIQVHRKTGSLYVIHEGSVKGRTRWQLVKLKSLDDPQIVSKLDLGEGSRWKPLLALDMWSAPAKVWLTRPKGGLYGYRETQKGFEIFRRFSDDVKKAGLRSNQMAARFPKVIADPNREQLYYYGTASSGYHRNAVRYDLATGKHKWASFPSTGRDFGHDYAFDKRGKIYTHLIGKVYRHDPDRKDKKGEMAQVPFDYGTVGAQTGAIALKDQPGAKGFQDGIGATMRGDVAVVSNIYYVPKFSDAAKALSGDLHGGIGGSTYTGFSHASFQRHIQDLIRKGEEVYSVKRRTGVKLSGGTIWTFDGTGELRGENAIPGLGLTNGVTLDEDGAIYTVCNMPKMAGGRAFLSGKGRVLGTKNMKTLHPFTGTFIKAPGSGAMILSKGAPMAADPYPKRAPDLTNSGWGWNVTSDNGFVKGTNGAWVEGAEWIYGGASPIVPLSCSCPNMRHATDWYKRSFIPEAYRHAVGIVDSAGNLIMHLGQYGNADSGRGPNSPVKVGGNEIAFLHVMYVTVTDKYLVASDSGNKRLIVMKLKYHANETASIQMK